MKELMPHLLEWKLPVSGLKTTLVKILEDYQESRNMNVGVFIDQPLHGTNRSTDSTDSSKK